MARTPRPWRSLEQWANAVMRARGYDRYELAAAGTGCWFYPALRYPDTGAKRDFWRLPVALQGPDGQLKVAA